MTFYASGVTTWVVLLLFQQLLGSAQCFGQNYPHWFLHPEKIECKKSVVGYASASFNPDSAASYAIRNGYENFARRISTKINGGQAFWNTEMGMFWMGSRFTERLDSADIDRAASILVPVDTLATKNFVAVLLTHSDCVLRDETRKYQSLKKLPLPTWIETPLQDSNYYYAVGLAPEYYYETNSWKEAETRARRNLARGVSTKFMPCKKAPFKVRRF